MHGRLACAGLCALLLLLPSAAAQASNDNLESAKPLPLGAEDATVDNGAFTIQPGEPLTAAGGASAQCQVTDPASTSAMDHTAWWAILGTGRPVTVEASGDGFDTVLGVFPAASAAVLCQDARGPESITFPSAAGQLYRIQVGSCATSAPAPCDPVGTGRIHVRATSPPPANDARWSATTLRSGQTVAGDNYAATEEGGEIVSCALQPYGRTVWYRLSAPSAGSLSVSVSGVNPSLAVFDAEGERLGCDATPGGGARLTLADVARGDLLVQVGGVGAHAGLVADSVQGAFTVQASFSAKGDSDHDGIADALDCRPDDAKIHPGARDVPGNRVDEDCSGSDASYPRLKSRARLAVVISRRYARLRSLAARNVPAGASVQLRCSGRSCPYRHSRARKVKRRARSVSLMSARLRRARIRPVTTFEVRVTKHGRMGSVLRYRFSRAGRKPIVTTLCLVPGAKRPSRCPT